MARDKGRGISLDRLFFSILARECHTAIFSEMSIKWTPEVIKENDGDLFNNRENDNIVKDCYYHILRYIAIFAAY